MYYQLVSWMFSSCKCYWNRQFTGKHWCYTRLGMRLHLAHKEAQDACDHRPDAGKEEADRNFHAHSHEEEAHQQALVGRDVALHLQRKFRLRNQQPRLHMVPFFSQYVVADIMLYLACDHACACPWQLGADIRG